MQILYINHYAGSKEHGMEYRPYYLALEWVKLGHTVTIVASSFSHLRKTNINITNKSNYFIEKLSNIQYIWCKTNKYSGNGIKRLLNIFIFLWRLLRLFPTLKNLNPEIIIASSTYPFDVYIAKKLAKHLHAKLIYEVHDLWPLTLIQLGGKSKYHPFIWFMQLAENYAYKNADKVVSILPNTKNYMQQHKMALDKFIFIPNGISVDQNIIPLPKNIQNTIDFIKHKYSFLVGYAGSMGESNALEYLIDAASLDLEIAYILIGDGSHKLALQDKVNKLFLKNVFFLPLILKPQIPHFLMQMDTLYIGWHNLSLYQYGVSPNKIFDYMLAKKPIIHSINTYSDIVSDANCGFLAQAENKYSILEAIYKVKMLSIAERDILGQNGYNYVTKYHQYSFLAQEFLLKIK